MARVKGSKTESEGVIIRIDDSKSVIESIIFARSQSYSDVYRFRFMIELVKIAQECVRENFSHVVNGEKIVLGEYKYAELSIPLRHILYSGEDKNYEKAKRSLLRFRDWVLVEDTGETFRMMPVLSFAELNKYDSSVRVEIRKNLWDSFMDFSKGYAEYNPEVILKISSPFGRQMYKGLMNQKGVVSYSVESLKRAFGYADKYTGRDMLFLHRVVDVAKAELDRIADYSFEYDIIFGHGNSDKGRRCITRLDFRSVRRAQNASGDVVRKLLHPSAVIGQKVYHVLLGKFYFTESEIKGNVKLFELAVKNLGEEAFLDWLYRLAPMAFRARTSTQGYVVGSLKRYLYQKCGIVFEKPVVMVPGGVAEIDAVCEVDVQEEQAPPACPPVSPAPQRAPASRPQPQASGMDVRPSMEDGLSKNQHIIGTVLRDLKLEFPD